MHIRQETVVFEVSSFVGNPVWLCGFWTFYQLTEHTDLCERFNFIFFLGGGGRSGGTISILCASQITFCWRNVLEKVGGGRRIRGGDGFPPIYRNFNFYWLEGSVRYWEAKLQYNQGLLTLTYLHQSFNYSKFQILFIYSSLSDWGEYFITVYITHLKKEDFSILRSFF